MGSVGSARTAAPAAQRHAHGQHGQAEEADGHGTTLVKGKGTGADRRGSAPARGRGQRVRKSLPAQGNPAPRGGAARAGWTAPDTASPHRPAPRPGPRNRQGRMKGPSPSRFYTRRGPGWGRTPGPRFRATACRRRPRRSAQERLVQPAVDGDDLAGRLAQPLAEQQEERLGLVGRRDRRLGQRAVGVELRQLVAQRVVGSRLACTECCTSPARRSRGRAGTSRCPAPPSPAPRR